MIYPENNNEPDKFINIAHHNLMGNQRGVSLLEVLIAIGIMIIVSAGFSTIMVNQQKEAKSLTEMLSSQDLMRSLTASLAKGDVCQYVLAPLPFNAQLVKDGTPQTIDLANSPIYSGMVNPTTPGPILIRKGDKASPYSNSVEVSAIKFVVDSGNYAGTGGAFKGYWLVEFDNSKLIRALKPVKITASFVADTSNATSATATTCNGSTPAGNQSLAGRLMVSDVIKNFANTVAVALPPFTLFGLTGTNSPITIDGNGLLSYTRTFNGSTALVSCQLSTVTGSCNMGSTEFRPTYEGIVTSSCSTTPISGPSMANFGGVSVSACQTGALGWTK